MIEEKEDTQRESIHLSFLSKIPLSSLLVGAVPVDPLPETASLAQFLDLTKKLKTTSYPVNSPADYMLNKMDALTALAFSGKTSTESLLLSDIVQSSLLSDNLVVFSYKAEEALVELMEPFSKGVRAVLVTLNQKNYLVSQTDILRFLLKAESALSAMVDGKISSIGIIAEEKEHVWQLDSDTALKEAIKKTFQRSKDVIVVSKNKEVVATLGNIDLVSFGAEEVNSVFSKKLGDFLSLGFAECNPEETLIEVMKKMKLKNKSEVVVLEKGKLLELITFNEIFTKFSKTDYRSNEESVRLSFYRRSI